MDSVIEDERRGYHEQMTWLKGKTIDEAKQALTARLATVREYEAYNHGGSTAIADYIEEQQKLTQG